MNSGTVEIDAVATLIVSIMKVLLKRCVLRILCVFLWAVFSAWLFVLMEYTKKDCARDKRSAADLILQVHGNETQHVARRLQ